MQWFRAWSEGIVIAVIITTLIEMLLPENTSKKYIKTLLGMFLMYIIIFPVINKISGLDVEKSLNFNKVIETSTNACNINELNNKIDNMALKIYEKNLEDNLKERLDNEGYIAEYVSIKISEDNSYNIESVTVKLSDKNENKKQEKQAYSIVEVVKQINVKISNNESTTKEVINENEKEQVKDFIKELYSVPKENISVN